VHILYLTDVYFPRINGVSTSIQTFRESLQALGHRVTLICPDYGTPPKHPDDPDVVRITARRVINDPEDRFLRWSALQAWAAKQDPAQFDLLHAETPFVAHYFAVRLARRWNKPLIESYHTFFEEYLHHYVPVAPAALTRLLARHFSRSQARAVDALIVPSSAMQQRLRKYGIDTPLHVLPTGLPHAAFVQGDGAAFRQTHNIPMEQPVLLHVGRVAHEKNIAFLLKALALLRTKHHEILLLITGEGPAEASLRHQAQQMGLTAHVRFLGYLDRQHELPACYAAADLFVFASKTETQGLVLLEAMAQGTAVVALAEMGTQDLLREGHGAYIAPDDVTGFAARIDEALSEPQQRAQTSARGKQHALQWSDQALAEKLLAIYQAQQDAGQYE
jgi:1,2-diacylglycerol 3-alpha-glucosyltransferase